MKLAEKMINPIRNQKGIALVVTLMLLVLGFAVVATLFRLSTQETKLARLEQGYTTELDAAKAGTDLFIQMVEFSQGGSTQVGNGPQNLGSASYLNGTCLTVKMSNPTSLWTAAGGWAGCPTQAQATSPFPTDSTNTANYYSDTTLSLGNYTVYAKLIDTFQTTSPGGNCPNGTYCPCTKGCYYYTVLTRAQTLGSNEHADIQFIYRYDVP
jgi:hypothetical protein